MEGDGDKNQSWGKIVEDIVRSVNYAANILVEDISSFIILYHIFYLFVWRSV